MPFPGLPASCQLAHRKVDFIGGDMTQGMGRRTKDRSRVQEWRRGWHPKSCAQGAGLPLTGWPSGNG